MIPEFVDIGSPWKVLPPGVHKATMIEIEARFAKSDHRKHLFSGFKKGVMGLRKAGCKFLYLDGSFVTEKAIPNDYDVCWETTGVNAAKLDPVLLDFSNRRKNQKKIYYGEFFPSNLLADRVNIFSDFFQLDKYTGKQKGIISIQFPKIKL